MCPPFKEEFIDVHNVSFAFADIVKDNFMGMSMRNENIINWKNYTNPFRPTMYQEMW
jgi:hypothetical protein